MAYAGTISMPDGTILHQWMLTETAAELAQMCTAEALDATCEAKAESRRKEILGERLLMKHIFGVPTPIMHDADRRPYLEQSETHISVAHTKGYLVIALNPHHSMGVDVEQYARRVLNVRDGFLNETEQQWLSPTDQLAHMIAWTAKEAIFKTIGERSRVSSYRNEIILHPFTTPTTAQTGNSQIKTGSNLTPTGSNLIHTGTFKNEQFHLHTILTPNHILTFSTPKRYTKIT
ncbi:MAG: 4'-phosphopantetheinyl transferase superfamily protein [Bacteroidales bacterium]|nr:4'-phosphopantetheinyl transferase superfamily protein [Bacteroidales bacterium]